MAQGLARNFNDYLLDLGLERVYGCAVTQAETNRTLILALEALQLQADHQRQMHGWIIAMNETLSQVVPDYSTRVERHPFYAHLPSPIDTMKLNLQNIDLLIEKLKAQVRP